MKAAPRVSVVVSTRDRGGGVLDAVRGILANDYPSFELWIVDQSEDDRTEASLKSVSSDPRMHYLRSDTRGLSKGLNIGIDRSANGIIAITGDDCSVPKDWLTTLVAAFEADRRIGLVFGNVVPGPHDTKKGFVPGYVRNSRETARSIREKHRLGGTSACMGVRRTVWQELGGFDPMLGVGAPFHSAEDMDLTMRALESGYHVNETPDVSVVHHGFYHWEERSSLVHRYWYGTGAAIVKQLKLRQWSILMVLLQLARGWVSYRSLVARSFGDRTHRLLGAKAFVLGSISGAFTTVDRSRGHYVESDRRSRGKGSGSSRAGTPAPARTA